MAENTYENAVTRPHLEFEDGVFSTYDIFQKCPLPVVVQCDTSKRSVPVERANFNFDLTQPILYYRKRKIQKIPAKSLHIDEDRNSFKEIGDPLLIPEDYKGYFAVIRKRNSSGPIDDHVPHFSRIEDLASSDTDQFLIGGQNRVQGFHVVNTPEESQSHQQRTLFPGDVLRKGKIFVGETKRKGKLFRKGSLVSEKYLSCIDEADREVLIPFAQTGLFYSLSNQSGTKMACPILQMENIVAQRILPCVVKLVYGRVPTTPCCFSGILQLEKSHLEQSIIAATIMNFKNILLEIPTTCDLDFFVAINNKDLLCHEGYSSAVKLCREKAQRYMTNIKVCYNAHNVPKNTSSDKFSVDPSEIPKIPGQLPPPSPCSKTTTRGTGYIPMHGKQTEGLENADTDSEGYVKMDSSPTLRTLPQPYMLKLFLENEYIDMPVYERKAYSPYDRQSVTEPPGSPPPPPPCIIPPPAPCKGSPTQDSGISDDISSSDFRRPSTFIFSEKEQFYSDDITYDIPKIPKRRESAPPDLNISLPHDSIPGSRQSSILPVMEETRDISASKDSVFDHSAPQSTDSENLKDSNEPPEYINVEGLKEITAKLESISEARTSGDENTAACFRWLSDPENNAAVFYDSSLRASVDLSSSSSVEHLSYSQNNLDVSDQPELKESESLNGIYEKVNNESIQELGAATTSDVSAKEICDAIDIDKSNCTINTDSSEIQEECKVPMVESDEYSSCSNEVVGEELDTGNDSKSDNSSTQRTEENESGDCVTIQSIERESESKEDLSVESNENETKRDVIVEECIDALNANTFELNDITNTQNTESEIENDNKRYNDVVDNATNKEDQDGYDNGNISQCQCTSEEVDNTREGSAQISSNVDIEIGMEKRTSQYPEHHVSETKTFSETDTTIINADVRTTDRDTSPLKVKNQRVFNKSGELRHSFRTQDRQFTYIISALDNANRSKSMDAIPSSHEEEPKRHDCFSDHDRLPNHHKSASDSDKNGHSQTQNLNDNIEKYRERSKTLWSVLRSRQQQSQPVVPRRGSLSNIDKFYFPKSKIIARKIDSERGKDQTCSACRKHGTSTSNIPLTGDKGKMDYPMIAPKPKDFTTITRRRTIAVPNPRTTATINTTQGQHMSLVTSTSVHQTVSPVTTTSVSQDAPSVTTNCVSQNSEVNESPATHSFTRPENLVVESEVHWTEKASGQIGSQLHACDQNDKSSSREPPPPTDSNGITSVKIHSPHYGDKQTPFLHNMSVDELDNALKEVGVKRESREYMRNRNIDGKQLIAMDIDSLGDELKGIGRIDLRKIAMVIRAGLPTFV